MPGWTQSYVNSLRERFQAITDGLEDQMETITSGRVAPAPDDLTLGSARQVRGAVLFFDLRGFSQRTATADIDRIAETLYMLDCVVPMVMHVVFDHGGYVEKNTGDGVMAVVGVGENDVKRANAALNIATIAFYVLKNVVNPHLEARGIKAVDARIGIDMGTLLLARIGTPKGTAKHDRSHVTAVGAPANLASKLQEWAGTNEIWTGDLIRTNAAEYRSGWFENATPSGWTWTWKSDNPNQHGKTYDIWRYTGVRNPPKN